VAKKNYRTRGMGHIKYRRDRKAWVGRITIGWTSDGKRKSKELWGSTKLAVEEKIKSYDAESARLLSPNSKDQGFGAYLDWWLENIVDPYLAPKTRVDYRSKVDNWIKPILGHLKLRDIRKQHVQELVTLITKKQSPQRARSVYTVMRICINHADSEGMLLKNPTKKIKLPKVPKAKSDYYDQAETKQLIRAATHDHRFGAAYLIGAMVGLRLGEVLGLQWKHIDLEAMTIRVEQQLQYVEGQFTYKQPKNNAVRTVSFPPQVLTSLKQLRKHTRVIGQDQLLFTYEKGTRMDPSQFTQKHWYPFIKHAGLRKIRFHDLRHTCASLLIGNGENLSDVSKHLGHTDIRITTNTYAHMLPDKEAGMAERLGKMLAT
tara:strand:+ start:813 stop:1934 length:1122 start_codon:yes stop_codon:yes gene_type:complete